MVTSSAIHLSLPPLSLATVNGCGSSSGLHYHSIAAYGCGVSTSPGGCEYRLRCHVVCVQLDARRGLPPSAAARSYRSGMDHYRFSVLSSMYILPAKELGLRGLSLDFARPYHCGIFSNSTPSCISLNESDYWTIGTAVDNCNNHTKSASCLGINGELAWYYNNRC